MRILGRLADRALVRLAPKTAARAAYCVKLDHCPDAPEFGGMKCLVNGQWVIYCEG